MEARREFLPIPKVQLKQTFWVTEDSMAKLLTAGAKYVDAVTQKNHYYDTASDDLAMAGLWLSRRDQEWFLIVESQEEGTQEKLEELTEEKAANPFPDPRETLFQKVIDDVQWENALACRKPSKQKMEEAEALLKTQHPQLDSTAAETECPKFSSAFTELVGESEITAYLAAHLRLDVNAEGRENATMEGFLQNVGIEHYASNHVVNQATYLLSDRYTVIVQRGEGSLRDSATVVLEIDVFNICQGLEEIEKLAAYLGFERQGVQSEREFMAE
ncbi:uncharacterized protein LOC117665085 [Pantherophis guttatus]|uniref:Uncharacterized protein LOC117665085 n=1 Tax=Pantherophis guttatus TaxID=94885 RepID=A0A6P9BMH6_PANGU|nr:uncharacterized protein LOC117665085 [Pantherophis guttatus]